MLVFSDFVFQMLVTDSCSHASLQNGARNKKLQKISSSDTTIPRILFKLDWLLGCFEIPQWQRHWQFLQPAFLAGTSLPFPLQHPGLFTFHLHSLSWLPTCTTLLQVNELLIIVSSFQWASGFVTFWYPGGSRNSRATLLPWHVFSGVYIYALSVATATTGILEKVTFLQTNSVISRYSTEALLVNSLGILMIVLGGFVVLASVTSLNSKGDIPRNATE